MGDSNNNEMIGFIASTVERISERLERVEERMVTKDIFEAAMAAVRGNFEQVHLRLDTMDHNIASRYEHVEGEISRLRSAVFLLGKDRPEILRLLGHNGS